jgi:ABC-type Mn2+/Zn2+ transport system ATPase subunit
MSIQVSNLVHPFISLSKIFPIEIISEKNKAIVVTGSNGSGKTTFLKLLLNELLPKRGKITVDGDIAFLGTKNGLKPQILLRQQLPYFLAKNVTFLWPHFLNMQYQELSAGQQRLVALWLILQTVKPIILLDEPFAHLDSSSRNMAYTWLNAKINSQKTIVFSHHNLEELTEINGLQVLDLNQH